MKPIIGITLECKEDPEDQRSGGNLALNWNYAQAVSDAGGVPILLPPTADMTVLAKLIDGLLIPGGLDIDASQFGEVNHPKVELQDPWRFAGEAALMAAIEPEMPVFGICYGCQFMNVYRGGTLIQHLPDEVGHNLHSGGTLQSYEIDAESQLKEIVGIKTMEGKSYHHQAVAKVGNHLRVVAKGEDGVIEALEATDRPWMIGVQWHPERTLSDPASRQLFTDFIAAAQKFAAGKSKVLTV